MAATQFFYFYFLVFIYLFWVREKESTNEMGSGGQRGRESKARRAQCGAGLGNYEIVS